MQRCDGVWFRHRGCAWEPVTESVLTEECPTLEATCELCGKQLTGNKTIVQHIKGRTHRENLKHQGLQTSKIRERREQDAPRTADGGSPHRRCEQPRDIAHRMRPALFCYSCKRLWVGTDALAKLLSDQHPTGACGEVTELATAAFGLAMYCTDCDLVVGEECRGTHAP